MTGDSVARVIVVILIAVFLGISAYTLLVPKLEAAPAGAAQGGRQNAEAGNALAITVSEKVMEGEVIRQYVKLNGDVALQSEISIYPETSGKIIRVIKHSGSPVARGDVIAYIDPSRPGAAYEEHPVVAPVSGAITSLPVTSPGALVSTSTVIAVIGSLDNLKITIYVSEKYSAYLRPGLPAFVSFSAAPGEELEASVSGVSPVVNSSNRTIETTLSLLKKDPRLKAGMFAAVRLVIREAADALVVPRTAIKDYNGENVVYVIDENDLAKRTSVTLGLTGDSDAQIVSGLSKGDRVIVAGSVTDGSPVRVAGNQ
jgi:multidrug efflux pump subunit AcrA (membrane-fusion protein)